MNRTGKKLLTAVIALIIGGLVVAAQQMGLIEASPEVETRTTRPNTPNRSPVPQRPAAPAEASSPAAADATADAQAAADQIDALFEARRSDVVLTAPLRVVHLLPDDNEGDRHQRFLADTANGLTLKIAHNIDLADRVPLSVGDAVTVKGEYEYNDKGGVLHWTHRTHGNHPHPHGYIEHRGVRYE